MSRAIRARTSAKAASRGDDATRREATTSYGRLFLGGTRRAASCCQQAQQRGCQQREAGRLGRPERGQDWPTRRLQRRTVKRELDEYVEEAVDLECTGVAAHWRDRGCAGGCVRRVQTEGQRAAQHRTAQ